MIGTKQELEKVIIGQIKVGQSIIKRSEHVRNLRVVDDKTKRMIPHVNQIC